MGNAKINGVVSEKTLAQVNPHTASKLRDQGSRPLLQSDMFTSLHPKSVSLLCTLSLPGSAPSSPALGAEQPLAATAIPRNPLLHGPVVPVRCPGPGHENQQAGLLLTPKAAWIEVTTATLILAFTDHMLFGLVTLCCLLRASRETWAIPSGCFLLCWWWL